MPNSPILEVETVDWTYEDVAEELEHLALLEDLEMPTEEAPTDLASLLLDDEIARAAEELRTVAELEGR